MLSPNMVQSPPLHYPHLTNPSLYSFYFQSICKYCLRTETEEFGGAGRKDSNSTIKSVSCRNSYIGKFIKVNQRCSSYVYPQD